MPQRTALIIEGGGMKAAYANGVLTAFEDAGRDAWGAIYGTSAGGALAAWYAAGQAKYAEGTWDYAADRRILSYRRWVSRRGHLLDHDALLDIVYELEHPIDQDAIRRARQPVIVTAADVDEGHCVYIDLRKVPIIPWLKATGRLPFAAGPAVMIEGHRYLDGGILDPIPIRRAVADGHTDITLILNSPAGPAKKDNPLVASVAARRYPALRDGITRHAAIKEEAMQYAADPPPGVRVRVIRPAQPTGIHRLSRDLEAIRKAIDQGHADGRAFLGGSIDAKRSVSKPTA